MKKSGSKIFVPALLAALLIAAAGCSKKDYSDTNGPAPASQPKATQGSQNAPQFTVRSAPKWGGGPGQQSSSTH
jgi:hypothetical protein